MLESLEVDCDLLILALGEVDAVSRLPFFGNRFRTATMLSVKERCTIEFGAAGQRGKSGSVEIAGVQAELFGHGVTAQVETRSRAGTAVPPLHMVESFAELLGMDAEQRLPDAGHRRVQFPENHGDRARETYRNRFLPLLTSNRVKLNNRVSLNFVPKAMSESKMYGTAFCQN